MNIETFATVVTIVSGIIGIVAAIVGLFAHSKKNTVIIKTKTKNGDIDFNNSIIGNEINKNMDKDKK